MTIIKTKEELLEFLETFPEGAYHWLNERYSEQEEHVFDNGGDFRDRESIIEEVWQGDIKYNMDDVKFEIPDEEAKQLINDYVD
jgi:hypothetical protein